MTVGESEARIARVSAVWPSGWNRGSGDEQRPGHSCAGPGPARSSTTRRRRERRSGPTRRSCPLESAYATASVRRPDRQDRLRGSGISVRLQGLLIAPYVDARLDRRVPQGRDSSTTIQDNAKPDRRRARQGQGEAGSAGSSWGTTSSIGDQRDGRSGPSAIGAIGGADRPCRSGPGAVVDGCDHRAPGRSSGRGRPGRPRRDLVPSGFRGPAGGPTSRTTAQASTPEPDGFVVKVTPADASCRDGRGQGGIADNSALAIGYATLYQGNSATGGAASLGPVPGPVAASGSTIYFGALNAVLGASRAGVEDRELRAGLGHADVPHCRRHPPTHRGQPRLPIPVRFIGAVSVAGQGADAVSSVIGKGDTVRADEGQPIQVGSIASLGDDVSIRSPLGGVQGTTTTTVVATVTDTVTGMTSTTTAASSVTSTGAPTASAGTTTATTAGTNAAGHATRGTTTTTVATRSTNLGTVTIGRSFSAGSDAVILGSPAVATTLGDGVTVGPGAVVSGSTIATPDTAYACALGGDDGGTLFYVTCPSPPLHDLVVGTGRLWAVDLAADAA